MNSSGSATLLSFQGETSRFINALISVQSGFVVGVFYWLPIAIAYAMKKARTYKRQGILAIAMLMIYMIPIRKWPAFQRSKIWDHLLKYFQLKVTGITPPSANTLAAYGTSGIMYGVAPHGIVPYSLGLTSFGSLGEFLHYPSMVSASIVRWIPIFAHMLFWGGAVEATNESITGVFTSNTGIGAGNNDISAVGITPGGIAEMYLGYPQPGYLENEEYALLNNRQGFIRIAIKQGLTLIPIFVYGSSSIFNRIVLPSFLENISRRLRASLMIFYGRLGLPVPYEVPLLYALGRHINLDMITDNVTATATAGIITQAAGALGVNVNVNVNLEPRQEEVDFVHNIFINELKRTFNTHKREYGWEHKTLKIV